MTPTWPDQDDVTVPYEAAGYLTRAQAGRRTL
jgi:hypothetical protein